MLHHTNIVPTLSAVRTVLASKRTLAPHRREKMLDALAALESLTGISLDQLAASVPELSDLLDRLDPKQIDVTPELLAQIKSRCRDAIAASALVPGVLGGGRDRQAQLTPRWVAFDRYFEGSAARSGLLRFMNWCSRQEISPRAVDDHIRATSSPV